MEECVYTWHNYNLNSLAILISSRFSVNGLVSSRLYSVFNFLLRWICGVMFKLP